MMLNSKKYSVALEKIPESERIIFKLICSVSARTKGRDKYYELVSQDHGDKTDLIIHGSDSSAPDDRKNAGVYHIEVNGSDAESDQVNKQILTKPLIATRVLAVLDTAVKQSELDSEANSVKEVIDENNVSESIVDSDAVAPDTVDTLNFEISEEEASELAIVHDESLANPANKDDEDLKEVGVAQVMPIRIASHFSTELTDEEKYSVETPVRKAESAATPRALVVDDSPSVRKQLELELDLFDVDVDFAATAKEALNFLDSEKYDVAFLDVVLPDKDGFSICRHIKEVSRETTVIMLTGKAKQADKVKGALAGCDAYMVKPVGRLMFQTTVKNYLSLVDSSSVIEA